MLTAIVSTFVQNSTALPLTCTAPGDEASKRRPRNSRPCRSLYPDWQAFGQHDYTGPSPETKWRKTVWPVRSIRICLLKDYHALIIYLAFHSFRFLLNNQRKGAGLYCLWNKLSPENISRTVPTSIPWVSVDVERFAQFWKMKVPTSG